MSPLGLGGAHNSTGEARADGDQSPRPRGLGREGPHQLACMCSTTHMLLCPCAPDRPYSIPNLLPRHLYLSHPKRLHRCNPRPAPPPSTPALLDVTSQVAQGTIRRVANEVFGHLHTLDLGFHLAKQTGSLARVVDRGTRGINFILSSMVRAPVPVLAGDTGED